MTRLFAIAVFIALAVLLIRYRTNKKIQEGVVVALIAGVLIYAFLVVVSELLR